jgi:hypothetical protein
VFIAFIQLAYSQCLYTCLSQFHPVLSKIRNFPNFSCNIQISDKFSTAYKGKKRMASSFQTTFSSTRTLLAKATSQIGRDNHAAALDFYRAAQKAYSEMTASLSPPLHIHTDLALVEFCGFLNKHVGYETEKCSMLRAGFCLMDEYLEYCFIM